MRRRRRNQNDVRKCKKCGEKMRWKTTAIQNEPGVRTSLVGYYYCANRSCPDYQRPE